jgi:hypothetical protein
LIGAQPTRMRRCVSNCGLLRRPQQTALPMSTRPTPTIARTAGQVYANIIGLVDSKHGTAANRNGPCRTACASLIEGISWHLLPVVRCHHECKKGAERHAAVVSASPQQRDWTVVELVENGLRRIFDRRRLDQANVWPPAQDQGSRAVFLTALAPAVSYFLVKARSRVGVGCAGPVCLALDRRTLPPAPQRAQSTLITIAAATSNARLHRAADAERLASGIAAGRPASGAGAEPLATGAGSGAGSSRSVRAGESTTFGRPSASRSSARRIW